MKTKKYPSKDVGKLRENDTEVGFPELQLYKPNQGIMHIIHPTVCNSQVITNHGFDSKNIAYASTADFNSCQSNQLSQFMKQPRVSASISSHPARKTGLFQVFMFLPYTLLH